MVELNKIYNEDCLETMARMGDKEVDLILTDPPYGVGIDYGDTFSDTRENVKNLISRIFPEMNRISKRIVLTPGIGNFHAYPEPDWVMAWVYSPGHSYCPWGFNSWQPIFVWGKDPYLENSMGCREDVIKKNFTVPKSAHPVPKSDYDWYVLLNRCSVRPSDIIYDPFMGSGTTSIACERLGRKWIGSEINSKFYMDATKRVSEFKSQEVMAFQ